MDHQIQCGNMYKKIHTRHARFPFLPAPEVLLILFHHQEVVCSSPDDHEYDQTDDPWRDTALFIDRLRFHCCCDLWCSRWSRCCGRGLCSSCGLCYNCKWREGIRPAFKV